MSLLSLPGGKEDCGGWGKVRNDKYYYEKDNNEDMIHVRRKVVNVGSVGKGLVMTGLDQRR